MRRGGGGGGGRSNRLPVRYWLVTLIVIIDGRSV